MSMMGKRKSVIVTDLGEFFRRIPSHKKVLNVYHAQIKDS